MSDDMCEMMSAPGIRLLAYPRRGSLIVVVTLLAVSLTACNGGGKTPTAPTPSIAAVAVTATTTTLVPGQSTQLGSRATADDGTAVSGVVVTWQSEPSAVATVDPFGRVTAVGAGTAIIVATAGAVRGTLPITVQPAPAPGVASLSSIIDSVRLAWKYPAMGAAIITLENGIVAIGAAGTRRASGGAAVTTNDLWHLGSNTKAMTALLAAVAVSQNGIQWTTTLAEAFPDVADIRAEYRDVTLGDLLSHQSGLAPGVAGGPDGGTMSAASYRETVVPLALQQAAPPGMKRGIFAYNNLGYVVASAMVERAFGTSFEGAMSTHVFAPLAMTDAGWGPQAANGSTTQPVAHRRRTDGSWGELEAFDLPPGYNGANGAHLSLASWGQFVREVLRVEEGTSTVAPAAVARQTTTGVIAMNPTTSYAMGWDVTTRAWAGGKVLAHSGSNTGNHSLAVLAPQRRVAFVLTTNGDDPTGASLQALNALHGRLVTFYDTGK